MSNKVKQVCYKIIFVNSLFIIYYDFFKIFNIVGNLKKKCGHCEKSCELMQLLFLRVYLSDLTERLVSEVRKAIPLGPRFFFGDFSVIDFSWRGTDEQVWFFMVSR